MVMMQANARMPTATPRPTEMSEGFFVLIVTSSSFVATTFSERMTMAGDVMVVASVTPFGEGVVVKGTTSLLFRLLHCLNVLQVDISHSLVMQCR